MPSVAFASFGSSCSQDDWFRILTGPCQNVLSRKEHILSNPHCILMNVCGDAPRAVPSSPASKAESSVFRVQICLLSKPPQREKKNPPWHCSTDQRPHRRSGFSSSTPTLLFFRSSSLTRFTFRISPLSPSFLLFIVSSPTPKHVSLYI